MLLYSSVKQGGLGAMARVRACTDGRVGVTACCWFRGKHQQEFSATGRTELLAERRIQCNLWPGVSPPLTPKEGFGTDNPPCPPVALTLAAHASHTTLVATTHATRPCGPRHTVRSRYRARAPEPTCAGPEGQRPLWASGASIVSTRSMSGYCATTISTRRFFSLPALPRLGARGLVDPIPSTATWSLGTPCLLM